MKSRCGVRSLVPACLPDSILGRADIGAGMRDFTGLPVSLAHMENVRY